MSVMPVSIAFAILEVPEAKSHSKHIARPCKKAAFSALDGLYRNGSCRTGN